MKQAIQQFRYLNYQAKELSESVFKQCQNDMTQVLRQSQQIIQKNKKDYDQLKKYTSKFVQSNKQNLKSLPDIKFNQESNKLQLATYVAILIGVYIAFQGKIPRPTQLLSLWFKTHCNRLFLQIKTGQGKTMIIAMIALYYALRGKKVDVITSSATLAKTQTQSNSQVYKLYKIFGFQVKDNCSSFQEGANAQKVYNAQIIYGTAFQFQADYLRKIFSNKKQYMKDRNFNQNHVALLDEVDALLIDRLRDSTRLSSDKPLYCSIRILLMLIYQIKQKWYIAKKTYVGKLKIQILGIQLSDLCQSINQDKQKLQKMLKMDDQTFLSEHQLQKKQEKQVIKRIAIAGLRSEKSLLKHFIPSYLDKYVDMMLPIWIDSCYQAQNYIQNTHYIVDNKARSVIPVDIASGNYQQNTKWSKGIHQFVQLYHGFQPSVDSLVTNFQSNFIYFTRFSTYFFGLSGTLSPSIYKDQEKGKSKFKNFLQQAYKAKILKVPTAKPRLLKILDAKLYISQQAYIQGLLNQAINQSEKRIVLIVVQTISRAKNLTERLFNKQRKIIQLYDQNIYYQTLQNLISKPKTIIISTNLGGRGTDIKISDRQILENGGLHVIMGYFPDNWRIQEQAFGRAGRNGQKGSGRFHIFQDRLAKFQNLVDNPEYSKEIFLKMLQLRLKISNFRFQKSANQIQSEQKKRKLLSQFIQKYINPINKQIQELENQYQKTKDKQNLIKREKQMFIRDNVEQQWGLFLNKQQKYINTRFENFNMQWESNKTNNFLNPGFYSYYGARMLKLDEKQAQKFFSQCPDRYQWVNLYYTTYFQLKKYENVDLTSQHAKIISEKLKILSNSMLIAYMISSLIAKNDQKKKNDLNTFLKKEMQHFYGTSEGLAQAISKNPNFNYKISLTIEDNQRGIQQYILKGYIYSFKIKIIPPKQQTGFWQGLCEGIKGVGKLIISTALTVFTSVAAPISFIFGFDKFGQDLISETISWWGSTCKSLGKFYKGAVLPLAPYATVGFSLLAIYCSLGFAIPAIIALAAWIHSIYISMDYYQSRKMDNKQLQLVKITGDVALDNEVKQLLEKIRQKSKNTKKQINQFYEVIKNQINQLRNGKINNLSKIEEYAFTNQIFLSRNVNNSTKYKQNTTNIHKLSKQNQKSRNSNVNQLSKKRQNLCKKVLNNLKVDQKLDYVIKQEQINLKNKANKYTQQCNVYLHNMQQQIKIKNQEQMGKIYTKATQNKYTQQQYNKQSNDYIQNRKKQDKKLIKNICNGLNLSIEEKQKIQTGNITKRLDELNLGDKFKKLQQQKTQIKQNINDINSQINKLNLLHQKPEIILSSTSKIPKLDQFFLSCKTQYASQLEYTIQQKKKIQINQINKQIQKQQSAGINQVTNKLQSKLKNHNTTPFQKIQQFNDTYHCGLPLKYFGQMLGYEHIQLDMNNQISLKELINNKSFIAHNKNMLIIRKGQKKIYLKIYGTISKQQQKKIQKITKILKTQVSKIDNHLPENQIGMHKILDTVQLVKLNKENFASTKTLGKKEQDIIYNYYIEGLAHSLVYQTLQQLKNKYQCVKKLITKRLQKKKKNPKYNQKLLPFQLQSQEPQIFEEVKDLLHNKIIRNYLKSQKIIKQFEKSIYPCLEKFEENSRLIYNQYNKL